VLLAFAGVADAQTVVLSDTSKATWSPSPDDGATFGTPPVPILTKYIAELFLKSAVNGAGVPSGPPAITLDFGKPAIVAGAQVSAPLKPMIQPNTEYVLFLSAVGPGGPSPRTTASPPFGFPSAPKGAASAVTFTP
jgi:hypothetical protein